MPHAAQHPAQPFHFVELMPVHPAEGSLEYLPPEGAAGERFAAAAELLRPDLTVPDVAQLPHRDDIVGLREHPREQCRAAAVGSGDEADGHGACRHVSSPSVLPDERSPATSRSLIPGRC